MANETRKYYAGIDLGGTFIKCGIIDGEGNLIKKDKVATSGKYGDVAKDMAELALRLAKEAGVELTAIGIGAPGMVDSKRGIIVFSGNLNWKKVPLAADVKKMTELPVFLTNDANAAALGEYAYGAGRKYEITILVTLGTGVGSGIVVDGKLYEGFKSAGAELGHTVIKVGGEKCTCGRRGCLEAYASTTALIRQTKAQMLKDKESKMWELCGGNLDEVNGMTVFDGVRAGDKSAKKVLNKYLEYLTEGLVAIGNAFRPEALLLGGGISAEGELLTKPLQRKVSRRIFGGVQYAPIKVVTATLRNDAGIYGSAKLACDKSAE